MSKMAQSVKGGLWVDISHGLKKQVFRKGAAGEPMKGATVVITYTTKDAKSGKVLDTNKNTGPLKFTLGKGAVIEGWDIVVGSMSAGECCKVTLPSNLAYGEIGKKPKIPPNTDVLVELELLSWAFDGYVEDSDEEEEGPIPEVPCYTCKLPLDRSYIASNYKHWTTHFHRRCYNCVGCKRSMLKIPHFRGDLNGKGHGEDLYCKECYYRAFGAICEACKGFIEGNKVEAFGKTYHPEHFSCAECHTQLSASEYVDGGGQPICVPCHKKKADSGPKKFSGTRAKATGLTCQHCKEEIFGASVEACHKKHWCLKHFMCNICSLPLEHVQHYEKGDNIYCYKHRHGVEAPRRKPRLPTFHVDPAVQGWAKKCSHFNFGSAPRKIVKEGLLGQARQDKQDVKERTFLLMTDYLLWISKDDSLFKSMPFRCAGSLPLKGATVSSGEVFGSPAVVVKNGSQDVVALALDEDMRDDWESEIEDTIFQAKSATSPVVTAAAPATTSPRAPPSRGPGHSASKSLGAVAGISGRFSPRGGPPPVPKKPSGLGSRPPPTPPSSGHFSPRARPPPTPPTSGTFSPRPASPPSKEKKKGGFFGKLFGSGKKMQAHSRSKSGPAPPIGKKGPLPPPSGPPPKEKRKIKAKTGVEGYD